MTGDGPALFDFLALAIGELLAQAPAEGDEVPALGFTFSFPVEQLKINSGKLIKWYKQFHHRFLLDSFLGLLSPYLQDQGFQHQWSSRRGCLQASH